MWRDVSWVPPELHTTAKAVQLILRSLDYKTMDYEAPTDERTEPARIHQQAQAQVQAQDSDNNENVTTLASSLDPSDHDEPRTCDPHAVSQVEAESYYFGLPSNPKLVYRTGAPWTPPRGPEAHRQRKFLREVHNHPLMDLWNGNLSWKVVEIMDTHKILFTSLDVVRFQMDFDDAPSDEEDGSVDGEGAVEVKKKPTVGPVTIWVGVLPGTTRATAAHDAAQSVLALLAENQITDVDVDFRESVTWR